MHVKHCPPLAITSSKELELVVAATPLHVATTPLRGGHHSSTYQHTLQGVYTAVTTGWHLEAAAIAAAVPCD
jgi:hypothetical protein